MMSSSRFNISRFNISGAKFFLGVLLTILFISPSLAQAQKGSPQCFSLALIRPRPLSKRIMTRLKFVDAATGKPLAHAPIQISSNNGVRCDRAPCPINSKHWSGSTDAAGVFVLPADIIQFETIIFAGRYSGSLSRLKTKNPKAMRVVKLSRIIYEDARLFHKPGETPLMQAAKRANIQAVSELLAQSPKVNAKDEEGSTALLYAQSPTHSLDAITNLVMSAPVSTLNAFNEPFNDLAKVMQVLLEHGADVNAANRRGDTALMRAAAAMNPRAVFVLLDGRAQVDAVDVNGNTALMRALLPIAETPALQSAQAMDEKRKYARRRVAHTLILAKLLPIVKTLIEKGANINAKNKQGETALILANRIAEHFGHRELATLLQQSGAQATPLEK